MTFESVMNQDQPSIMNKEVYGYGILSRIILMTSNNCYDVFEKLEKPLTFSDYLIFLQYHLFIAQKILETRYNMCDIQSIMTLALVGIVDYSDIIPYENKNDCKDMISEWYAETADYLKDIDIYDKQGLEKLADCFLQDCKMHKDIHSHLSIFLLFSSFVIHHTNDILNDKIILKNCPVKQ